MIAIYLNIYLKRRYLKDTPIYEHNYQSLRVNLILCSLAGSSIKFFPDLLIHKFLALTSVLGMDSIMWNGRYI